MISKITIESAPSLDAPLIIMRPVGEMARGEGSKMFRNAVSRQKPRTRLVVDMSHVSFGDGNGIEELINAFVEVRSNGGDLKLFGLQEQAKALLETTNLHLVFDVYDGEDNAVASFGPPRGALFRNASPAATPV